MFHMFEYEDVMTSDNLDKLSENYEEYEEKISKLKEHIEEIYELIAGDNAITWSQDEMIDYIKVLNGQIAEWQDKEDEKVTTRTFTQCSFDEPCEYQVETTVLKI